MSTTTIRLPLPFALVVALVVLVTLGVFTAGVVCGVLISPRTATTPHVQQLPAADQDDPISDDVRIRQEWLSDPATARKKYAGKMLTVRITISQVMPDDTNNGHPFVVGSEKISDKGFTIFQFDNNADVANLKPQQKVTVYGMCLELEQSILIFQKCRIIK